MDNMHTSEQVHLEWWEIFMQSYNGTFTLSKLRL